MVKQAGKRKTSRYMGSVRISGLIFFKGFFMKKVAILVDGGFYRKVSNHMWGDKTPEESVDDLIKYCHFHLKERDNFIIDNGKKKYEYNDLYRIFYYDCKPLDKIIYNPLTQKNIKFNESKIYNWMTQFLNNLKLRRKVALRMGFLLMKK